MNITTRQIDYWQAIIFDFDGVIVESGDIKAQAFAELYRHHGETIAQAAVDYHRTNGGMSRYLKFHYFQQNLLNNPPLTKEEEQELDQRFSKLVMNAVIACQPVAGAEVLLHRMVEQIPLFVASGTPENELRTIVERRSLSRYFTGVHGSPRFKEALVADILSAHPLDPERVLMVGDALVDYESAHQNGVAFLGRVRPGDDNPFPESVEIVPDLCPLTT
ncbi:Phosphoglycolate phosphatase, HAD superfamily [Nitrosomonas eutropha]|uniref:phosphoglycolate phosphatase n=1 Tax=Nitrosomonas eutropha TaxID=916 RepID=A0A1I7HTH6_9PROT|nr:HAD hydrolase-like protein [Nitrosomonas eutropha]SFU64042.1 Phosphoglycolate phosphatase, HAD superfamily [Nitrosomonas eutropha]